MDDEDCTEWLLAPPNLDELSEHERAAARERVTEVASRLRFVQTSLLGVEVTDASLGGLTHGIVPHLERAADLLLSDDPYARKLAHGEMQMACEVALKALQKQRTGKFTKTHDLFVLYDRIPAPSPNFNRDLLKRLPCWEDMADLRFAQQDRPRTVPETYRCYQAALEVAAGAVDVMNRMRLGSARFEIAQPPWLRR